MSRIGFIGRLASHTVRLSTVVAIAVLGIVNGTYWWNRFVHLPGLLVAVISGVAVVAAIVEGAYRTDLRTSADAFHNGAFTVINAVERGDFQKGAQINIQGNTMTNVGTGVAIHHAPPAPPDSQPSV